MGGTHFLQTGYLLLNRNAPFTYVKCIFKVFGKLDNYSCPIVYCCLITHKQGISLLFYLKKE